MGSATSPEQELEWAEEDLRIAKDNLDTAQRRLDDAAEEYGGALRAVALAREAAEGSHDAGSQRAVRRGLH